jgi:predicted metal-dependent hydrolase
MPLIDDKEFGQVTVRRITRAKSMRATVAPNGSLRISVPSYAPLFMVRRMIAGSRPQLRKLLATRPALVLHDGMPVGKSHSLVLRTGPTMTIRRTGQQLIVTTPDSELLDDPELIQAIRSHMQAILRREAKQYLPKRIEQLALAHGFDFSSLRFTHASSRWGSCNQSKAISLNIALMNLPFELIDYVLFHELAHTKHLNHSLSFWNEVERVDPTYKLHRKQLKGYDPGI